MEQRKWDQAHRLNRYMIRYAFAALLIAAIGISTAVPSAGAAGIDGYVVDEQGAFVPGATVDVWSPSTLVYDYAYTDAQGYFTFMDLPAVADFILAVYIPGYPTVYYDGQLSEDLADPLNLTAGDVMILIDLSTIDFGGVIWGYIYENDGPPQQTLWVEAWTLDFEFAGSSPVFIEPDFGGYYEIWGLDPFQSYIISVWPDEGSGVYYSEDVYGFPLTVFSWDQATPVQPSTFYSRDFYITAEGGSIRGAVLLGDAPYEGAWVEVWNPDTGVWAYAETTGNLVDGANYAIASLPFGVYDVTVYTGDDLESPPTQSVSVADSVPVDASFNLSAFNGAVSGTIQGLAPGEFAIVSAWSIPNDYYEEAMVMGTGGAVDYAISGLPPAEDYIVEIFPGLHPYQIYDGAYDWQNAALVDITAGNRTDIDFSLIGGSDLVSISGTIYFPDTAPVGESVWVEAASGSAAFWGGVEVRKTIETGNAVPYEITGLIKASDYRVGAWPDTLKPKYYENSGSWDGAALVDVSAASESGIDIALIEGSSISGAVQDENGTGVSGVLVSAWSYATAGYAETFTGFNGGYTISGLEPAADYIVEAYSFEFGSYYYGETTTVRDDAAASRVNISDGPKTGINILILPGEKIIGRVLNSSGKPVPGIWVSAWSEALQAGNETFTDFNGEFTIPGLPKGVDYEVSVWPDWDADYFSVAKTNVATCAAECKSVDLILKEKGDTVTLSGRVTDPGGAPSSGAVVEVWSDAVGEYGGYGWAVTDGNGAYAIARLAPSVDYELTVWPATDSAWAVHTDAVSLTADTVLDITLARGGAVEGTVTSPGGAPVEGAWVFIYSESGLFWNYAVTDATGGYAILQAPMGLGDLELFVFKEGFLEAIRPVVFDADPSIIDVVLRVSGVISGLVTANGVPAPGAVIEVILPGSEGVETPVRAARNTGPDGRYVITGFPAADENDASITNYEVWAKAEGYPHQTKTGITSGDEVDFELGRGASNRLEGRVVNFDASAFNNAYLVANAFNTEDRNDWRWAPVSDQDGSFAFTDLIGGKSYYLTFSAHEIVGDGLLYNQWDVGGSGVTVIDPDTPPANASIRSTEQIVDFTFDLSGARRAVDQRPGRVRNLRTTGDLVQNLARTTSEKIVNKPDVTVRWEPSEPDRKEIYYYAFNTNADHKITKRNARKPGINARQATSHALSGDNASFYAHVAVEDDRARIGDTSRLSFKLDTVAPKNPTVKVDAGQKTRSSGNVILKLGAVNATEMYVSNVNYGQGGQWENYKDAKEWKAAAGGGSNTIYVLFRDDAHNVSRTSLALQAETSPLQNTIRVLKILTGIDAAVDRPAELDGAADDVINLKDAVFHLQKAANVR